MSAYSKNPAARPQKGDRLRLSLDRPAAEGLCVASHHGFVVLVSRGAVGEEVEAEVERVDSRYAIARTVNVLATSPERIAPPCPHYARCGGCDLQHVTYAEQMRVKRAALTDQLQRIGGLHDVPPFDFVQAPDPFRYRDRLDFVLQPQGGGAPPKLAFHGLPGGPLEPITDCLLAPPELTALGHAAAQALAGSPAMPSRIRVQRSLGLAGQMGMALTLFATSDAHARKLAKSSTRWLPRLHGSAPELRQVSIVLAPGSEAAAAEEDGAEGAATVLQGDATLAKRLGSRTYRVPPGGFFQVHPAQAQRLIEHVIESVGRSHGLVPAAEPLRLLDLYCGAGLFTLPLAEAGHRILGVESSPTAVRAARQTARETLFPAGAKPDFKVRDLEEANALEDLVRMIGPPDVIVLDPPRRGLAPSLVHSLLSIRPDTLVYVSCDGGSFSRDTARLTERYVLTSLHAFDLFPQTHHLEVVGVFRRNGK